MTNVKQWAYSFQKTKTIYLLFLIIIIIIVIIVLREKKALEVQVFACMTSTTHL